MKVVKRKVMRVGTSLAITLPVKFVEAHNLKAGDEVAVLMSDAQWLRVVPYKSFKGKEVQK